MAENLRLGLSVGGNVTMSVLVMFLLMAIGFVLAKKKIVNDIGIKQLTEILLVAVVPCVIIDAYQRDFDVSMAKNLCIALVFALIVHIIGMIISPLIFRGKKSREVNVFGAVYSNCGFMALPLIQSLYGSEGVFYAVAYVTVFNILYWTHGVYVYTGDIKQLSFKKAFTTPGLIGTIIGVLLFFLKIRLPEPITRTVSFMAALNTPIPMMILGTYLVNLKLKETMKNLSLWGICLFRLIVFPIIGILVARLMGLEQIISMTLIVSCACPVAAAAALFAVRYNSDSEYASQAVSMSTLLSVITIPLIMILAAVVLV